MTRDTKTLYSHDMDTFPKAAFADHAQSKHNEELGHLPRQALREYEARNQILTATENHQFVSYMLYYDGRNGKRPRAHPDTIKIHQCFTDYDARRLHIATALLNKLIDHANDTKFRYLKAFVATDLEANDFWKTVGFTLIGTRPGGLSRKRVHNIWVADLQPEQPSPTLTTSDNKRNQQGTPIADYRSLGRDAEH